MAVFKCKMCGGNLEISAGVTVCKCEYCGTNQTVPRADNDKKLALFSRANRLRFECEFDKASGIYEAIIADFPEEAEAYWGLVLCKYGIEYVDDPATAKKIPTCRRSSFESVMDDRNFDLVMENSDSSSRPIYREEAKQIEELRKRIIEVSSKEEPYDIFICYKENDENGNRTVDSVLAQDVYDALSEKGYRVFFSRITLEDKLGVEYEPYIFAALNSAKVMLAFGSDYEYYNAVWVKNEWSRFLQLIAKGEKKTLIPCYKNIDAYDMPKEFAKLQAQDMGKVGAVQDLIRGIEKILPKNKSAAGADLAANEHIENQMVDSMLKKAYDFLSKGDFKSANVCLDTVHAYDADNALYYIGKIMAKCHCRELNKLSESKISVLEMPWFKPALKTADAGLKTQLINAALQTAYNEAKIISDAKHSKEDYQYAYDLLQKVDFGKYKTADTNLESKVNSLKNKLSEQIAAGKRKSSGKKILFIALALVAAAAIALAVVKAAIPFSKISNAKKLVSSENYDEAYEILEKLGGNHFMLSEEYDIAVQLMYRGQDDLAAAVLKLINKSDALPQIKLDKAIKLYDSGNSDAAYADIYSLKGESSLTAEMYKLGEEYMQKKKYDMAYVLLSELNYKDSEEKINICQSNSKGVNQSVKYNAAVALMNNKKYNEAITAFETLNGYKDSDAQLIECRYKNAISLIDDGKIIDAYESLVALNGYKDSATKASEIFGQYEIEKLKIAEIGDIVFFGKNGQYNSRNGLIEWLVLAKENGKALLISKGNVYSMQYLQYYYPKLKNVVAVWENSDIRLWLNGTFFENAFSASEQAKILITNVTADKNPIFSNIDPGNSTKDKVFLLSIAEAEKYFISDSARKDSKGAAWWLRTPGNYPDSPAEVYGNGSIHYTGRLCDQSVAVRPAMWVNIESK